MTKTTPAPTKAALVDPRSLVERRAFDDVSKWTWFVRMTLCRPRHYHQATLDRRLAEFAEYCREYVRIYDERLDS